MSEEKREYCFFAGKAGLDLHFEGDNGHTLSLNLLESYTKVA